MLRIRAALGDRSLQALTWIVILAMPAHAAESVLQLLPDNTLGFVVVQEMSEVSQKVARQAELLGVAAPDVLEMAKGMAGIEQGLDEAGALLLAVASSGDESKPLEDSQGLLAVPVSDYAQFIEQWNGDAAAEVTEVEVAGQSMLMAEKSGYALLVRSDEEHRALLNQVLARDVASDPEIAPLEEWIRGNDATFALLSLGVQRLTARGITELEQVQQHFAETLELGAQTDQVAAAFGMYIQLLQGAQEHVATIADGFRVDEAGNIRIGSRVRFQEDSPLAQVSDTSPQSTTSLLAGLPDGPFVGAFGASLTPECGELLGKWSVEMMKANPALYGIELSDEAADQYLELTLASMRALNGFSGLFSAAPENETLLGGMQGVIFTSDAQGYLATYEEAMAQFQELIDATEGKFPYEVEVAKAELAGVSGLRVTMDMSAVLGAQAGGPEAAAILDKMFGAGGKLTTHVLAATKDKVLFSYGSEQTVKRQLAAVQAGASDLATEASVAGALALLPQDADMVAFLSPQGAVAWFQQIAPTEQLGEIPEFSQTPAVGFAAKIVAGGLEAECVVPAELPLAIKEYVESLRQ